MQQLNYLIRRCGIAAMILTTAITTDVILARSTLAEISTDAYTQMRSNAPESLKIRVIKVKTQKLPNSLMVDVQAKVISVGRSKSKLKPGSLIKIRYESIIPQPGWVGPHPTAVLKKAVYSALLTQDGKVYVPAAYSQSFDLIKVKR